MTLGEPLGKNNEKEMQYIEKRGLKVSKFTLGTCQLGYNYGIANRTGQPSEQQSFEILHTAIKNGVNSFDTASAYKVSEELLGEFFNNRQNTLPQPVIITKIADFNFDSNNTIRKSMYDQVENSLNKMKIKRIPVLMLHHFSDFIKGKDAVMENLKEIKGSGKAGIIGISLYAEDDMDMVLNEDAFEAVQIPMNIFDHRLIRSGILLEFKKRDIFVFVRSVFLQGLFFLNPENLPESLQVAKQPLEKLHELANKAGMSITQLCTSFIKDLDGVSSLVMGCETVKQIQDNALLVMNSGMVEKDIVDEILDYYREIPQKIINPVLWYR